MLATYSMLSHSILFYVISITACPPHLTLFLLCLRFSQCRLSFKQTTRANKVKYFLLFTRGFFSVLLAAFVSAVAAPLLLLLLHTFFGNVQINYNALTVSVCCCLPSLSLSLSVSCCLSCFYACEWISF